MGVAFYYPLFCSLVYTAVPHTVLFAHAYWLARRWLAKYYSPPSRHVAWRTNRRDCIKVFFYFLPCLYTFTSLHHVKWFQTEFHNHRFSYVSQIETFFSYSKKKCFVNFFFFLNSAVEANLNGGIVHVVAQFHGRTLHDVKHNVCKVDADSFSCPMHKGSKHIK